MKLGLIAIAATAEELEKVKALFGKLEGSFSSDVANVTAVATAVEEEDDDLFSDDEPELYTPTQAELVKVLTSVKDDVSKDKLIELLKAHGASNLKTLDEAEWPAIYAEANNLLGNGEASDDDIFGDDESAPDPDVVKTAVQAMAAKKGKEKAAKVLQDVGLNTVRGLKSASEDVLNKVWAAVKEFATE